MALEKLKILDEEDNELVEALINPNQITIVKSVNWRSAPTNQRDVPAAQFLHAEAATLSMELFFDTYEEEGGEAQKDVRKHTDKIVSLTAVDGELHRPPLCKLVWGQFQFPTVKWRLQQLNQRFTLFLPGGTPVRAVLTCTFIEWRSDEDEQKLQNKQSANIPKSYTVRRGDTLSGIAASQYRDPALWRVIAQANQIDNPRNLTPGQTLRVPALRTSRR